MTSARERWVRHIAVAALGAGSMVAVQVAGTVIGIGALLFVPAAGLVAVAVLPTWSGWVSVVLGSWAAIAVASVTGRASGPWVVMFPLMGLLASVGWFLGQAVRRARHLGLRPALGDAQFAGSLAAMVGSAALFVWAMGLLSAPQG